MSSRLTAAEEKQISELIARMTLDEKLSCCHASSKFATSGVPRLGIPPLTMSDGPHGVREEISPDSWEAAGWDTDFCTYLPTGTALAATWNRKCARLHGEVLGSEAREREKDVILGPGINMIRQPLCGRNFEYYCEDPYQAGELAAEAIQGIQSKGTACCVKHYALNSQELNRHRVNALCTERTLREMYLPAFEKAVKKGEAMTIMGAYNFFRGQHCCENDYLLNQILKKEWGFDGVVISDWNGVHDISAAANGMDLEMGTAKPYNEYFLADAFRDAVKRGEIDEAVLDDKVRRYLRLMFKLGKLGNRPRPAGERNTPGHQRAAREIGAEAMVLLKNEGSLLPLDPAKIKKVLVVGDNATMKHHRGGNSSGVKALYEVSPLEGLQEYCSGKNIELRYMRGYPSRVTPGKAIPATMMGIADAGAGTHGWVCSFFSGRGLMGDGDIPLAVPCNAKVGKSSPKVLLRTVPFPEPKFDETTDLPEELKGMDYLAEMDGCFTPDRTGEWHFWLRGASQSSFSVDNVEVISSCRGENDVTSECIVELEAGRSYHLHLRLHEFWDLPIFPMELTCAFGDEAKQAAAPESAEVLEAARGADAVLFFGGISHTDDTESADKPDMKLRGGQNELISAIAKVNPNVAVSLVAGSPVEMPWSGEVPAILLMWYDGMEAGHVVTDVLFGEVNPSGKLPFTFPENYEKSPMGGDADYNGQTCYYKENLFFGYRWYDAKGVRPRFPFGFGLSYSTFRISDAKVDLADVDSVTCSLLVTNTGSRAGAEVVQLYVEPEAVPGVRRPVRELKGFEKVFLAPGESSRVRFTLENDAFRFFHPVEREWVLRPGKYTLCIGNASDALPIRLEVAR